MENEVSTDTAATSSDNSELSFEEQLDRAFDEPDETQQENTQTT